MTTRRNFLQLTSAAALAGTFARPAPAANGFNGTLCLFSKHLPEMNWQQLAQAVKKLGFGGIDLTVRAKGHVLPARAAEDLPKAVAAIRAEELSVPMITTELTSASDPTAKPILQTAGKLQIPYCKPGYWKYQFVDVR